MMKQLIFTFLFFLNCNYAIGDCGNFVRFYPEEDIITENSYIIIEGQGGDYPGGIITTIEGLGSVYPLFLVCGNQRIKLNLKDIIKGQSGAVQAIFYPNVKLTFGNRYELNIENLTCDEEHKFKDKKKYNNILESYEFKSWTVSKPADNESPILLTKPKLLEKKVQGFGCGTAINTIFSIEVKDESETLVLVELKEIESNTIATFYIGIKESKLYIGKGMCNGAFVYKVNLNYKVRFKVYDINGNSDDNWTEVIEFTSPLMS